MVERKSYLTLFIGDNLIGGSYNETIDHYDLLRTLEDMYGLNYCGNSATATPIIDCWAEIVTGISLPTTNFENALLYPNPANQDLNIELNLEKPESVHITISNLFSQSFAVYENQWGAGRNQVNLPLENFENGTYFVNIKSAQKSETRKLVVKK